MAATPSSLPCSCHSGTASAPASSRPRRVSRSQFEPGKTTTPMRVTRRPPRGSQSIRSRTTRSGGSRTAPPPAARRSPVPRPRSAPRPSAPPAARPEPPRRSRRRGGRGCPRPPAPAGRGCPPSAGRSPRTGTRSWRDHVLLEIALETGAGDPLERLDVARARARDDRLRELGARLPLVPRLALQPVAHELFVEAGLRPARRVRRGIPEPRRIGGEDLVDQRELAIDQAHLELGVGEDDSRPGAAGGPEIVPVEGDRTDSGREIPCSALAEGVAAVVGRPGREPVDHGL